MEVVSSETRPSISTPPKLTCCEYPFLRAFMSCCTARDRLRDVLKEAKDAGLLVVGGRWKKQRNVLGMPLRTSPGTMKINSGPERCK